MGSVGRVLLIRFGEIRSVFVSRGLCLRPRVYVWHVMPMRGLIRMGLGVSVMGGILAMGLVVGDCGDFFTIFYG